LNATDGMVDEEEKNMEDSVDVEGDDSDDDGGEDDESLTDDASHSDSRTQQIDPTADVKKPLNPIPMAQLTLPVDDNLNTKEEITDAENMQMEYSALFVAYGNDGGHAVGTRQIDFFCGTRQIDSLGGRFECEICYKTFANVTNLRRHQKLKKTCQLPAVVESQSVIHEAENRQHEKDEPPTASESVAEHQDRRYSDNTLTTAAVREKNRCVKCAVSFANLYSLNRHVQSRICEKKNKTKLAKLTGGQPKPILPDLGGKRQQPVKTLWFEEEADMVTDDGTVQQNTSSGGEEGGGDRLALVRQHASGFRYSSRSNPSARAHHMAIDGSKDEFTLLGNDVAVRLRRMSHQHRIAYLNTKRTLLEALTMAENDVADALLLDREILLSKEMDDWYN